MWAKVRSLFEKHRRIIMGVLLGIVVAIWVSQPMQKALPFEAAMAVTTSAILMFVILILDYLVTIKRPLGIEIYKDENSAKNRLETYVKDEKPVNVQLIECSATSVNSLLQELEAAESNIKILICDPWAAISDYQRKYRICPNIIRLHAIIKKPSNFKVKCYPGNASLRGRNFDNRLIALSWYTYEIKEELADSLGDKQIWGDENSILIVPVEATGVESLVKLFNKVFDSLWARGVPLEKVCGNCPEREKCGGRPKDQWLRLTNPDDKGGIKDEA